MMADSSKKKKLTCTFCLLAVPGPVPPPPTPSPNDTTTTSVVIGWSRPPSANGVIRNFTIRFSAVRLLSDSSNSKRRRRASDNILNKCIVGGQSMIDRSETVPGNQTSAMLMDLSEGLKL